MNHDPVGYPSKLSLIAVGRSFQSANGTVDVVRDVNLEVAEGEIVCVIGPSGAGKTTILRFIAGFDTPDTGQVLSDGKEVKGPSPDRCMVFQQYAVFPWLTVRKNIEFGLTLKRNQTAKERRHEISDHYLEVMGLTAFANAYPATLSGGMQQRVAIARAYAVSPEILLMDEPFGALDAQTRSQMQSQLLEVMHNEGRTVVFITHSVEEALYIGHRVVLLGGKPANVAEQVEVPFEHPRRPSLKTSHEFNDLRRYLEEAMAGRSKSATSDEEEWS